MSQSIAGSVAFVTGANRGLGAALVQSLLSRGAQKVYAAARSLDSLETLVATGEGKVVPVQLDVTDTEAIRAAAALATDTTLLINNAGIVAAAFRPITEAATVDDLRRELDVNAIAPHAITQAFASTLIASTQTSPVSTPRRAAVVNIASVVSFVSFPAAPTYSASKATTHSLTQGWRHTLAPHGVDVLGAYPGPVDTDMGRDLPIDKTPALDVANAILDGIEAGTQEILPDVVALAQGAQYLANPKALEQQVSQQMSQEMATV
ncbi:MAG TPA: KR domain-containing protein [Gemmatimonas aurantiaca]|uniref:KR domain-containing protein n=2 Tax=Gemmatimonas aurantiaca TaxID=173480 RepID=A0A3D4VDZ8_9BACT|nr:SDR family NAD(P)-dependent oxidoreductase [Gemmatimonas aurantiaca]BAH37109.1 putative oxidoreductase [Gemmatimonas aurantiaca T-27]HCT58858.1 KR domain-containing protein [Gemmatimonas aurantiaca]